eukprot:gnl/TRDRNA2_/TRDRNA2_30329_c0_seq1.p1 gnl/TRDRNA2_/TRDRNA2_30329_c0~~gnl/TRDRNA2_/TRDRNA2_30329_c0_seq1.p1  ORF type:complete len:385 (-),score=58.93 gnl/TRDRNA2_/TRDRNA2_30329_c0_seq1:91-1245(-)
MWNASVRSAACGCSARRHFAQVTVSQGRLEEFIRAEMNYFSLRNPQPVKLRHIVHARAPNQVAKLVHSELPVRFAARIKHLETLSGWEQIPPLVEMHSILETSFRQLRLSQPSRDSEFTEVIYNMRRRHIMARRLLVEAIRKMKEQGLLMEASFNPWADQYLQSRISTEMLTSHYIACIEGEDKQASSPQTITGIIDTKCDPGQICQQAAEQVREYCASCAVPFNVEITVEKHACTSSREKIEFSYVPTYLCYIVEELLKNSARATFATKGPDAMAKHPIQVTVCADERQVAIRISDQGGGIPWSNADDCWSYVFSTSEEEVGEAQENESPLAGQGMGLPLSRLYAKYLGGSLELMNMPGIGVDAYLFLSRIDPRESFDTDMEE